MISIKKYLKVFFAFFSVFFCASALAQNSSPNIAYVYPAGAQRGATSKILIGGKKFKDAKAVYVSGKGVTGKIVEVLNPPDRNIFPALHNKFEKKYLIEHPELKEEMEADLQKARAKIRKAVFENKENADEFREAGEGYYLRFVSSDPMAESVEIELTVAPDAELGERDIKILTPAGLSNSMKFMIGSLPEKSKPSLRAAARERVKLPEYWSGVNLRTWKDTVFILPSQREIMEVDLPAVLNGQIVEDKTDSYSFEAKKGQKIIVCVWAQSLIPYISDAVPGWFQPVVKIRDADGNEQAYNDDFFHHPDPYLVFEVPQDGKYFIEIFDAIYRSREDFVYRMLIGEVPFVEYVFPLGLNSTNEILSEKNDGIRSGTFELASVNTSKKTQILRSDENGNLQFASDELFHKEIPLDGVRREGVLSLAEIRRTFGQDKEVSQKLKLPALVDGRITRPFGADVYKFYAREGEKIEIEIFARRLNSPLDSALELRDLQGELIQTADDFEDASCAMVTHHADSRMIFSPKESGEYVLRVFDARGASSNAHSYRLSIGAPQADFKLKSQPANINICPRETVAVRVVAFRKNEMNAPITLSVKNLPEDFKVYNNVIESGKDYVDLMISAPAKTEPQICQIEILGEAKSDGKSILRKAVPSQDMMQAFYYRHLVPCKEMSLSVNAPSGSAGKYRAFSPIPMQIPQPVAIPFGEKIHLLVGTMPRGNFRGVRAAFFEPIEGLRIGAVYVNKGLAYVEIICDKEKVKLGQKGELSIVFKGAAGRDFEDFNILAPVKYEICPKDKIKDFQNKQWELVLKYEIKEKPKQKQEQKNKDNQQKKENAKIVKNEIPTQSTKVGGAKSAEVKAVSQKQ